jgi:Gram-negative bacterial TonB protein C-terminal
VALLNVYNETAPAHDRVSITIVAMTLPGAVKTDGFTGQAPERLVTPPEPPPAPEHVAAPERVVAPETVAAAEPAPPGESKPKAVPSIRLFVRPARRQEQTAEDSWPMPAPAVRFIRRLMRAVHRQEQAAEDPPRRKPRLLLPLIGWIALCVAAVGVYELWTMARAARWAPLGLNAQMANGAIHLAWDQNLRTVRDASRGVLTIDEGTVSKHLALTPEQVRAGHYDYQPAASDVLFRLELFGSGLQAAGDSLRLVAAPSVAAAMPKEAPLPQPEVSAERAAGREVPDPSGFIVAVPPEPLHEVHPEIPPGVRARIHDRVVVPVKVKVTAAGRVASATPANSGDDVYQYLAARATQAARQWRFSPARARNGKPIDASRIVNFVFTGPES